MHNLFLTCLGTPSNDAVGLFEPFRRQGHDLAPLPVYGQSIDVLPREKVHDLFDKHREMIEAEVMTGLVLEAVLAVGIASQGREQDD